MIKTKKIIKCIPIIVILALLIFIVQGCGLKCPPPAMIDYDNKVCCDDLNKNHKCDNSEEKPIKFPGVDAIMAKNDDSNKQNIEKEAVKTIVEMMTNKGTIKIQLEDEKAPITTKNFIGL